MDRMNKKYVIPSTMIPEILKALTPFYYIQEINNRTIASYATLYYDTPDFSFYHAHVNGKLNRSKVRVREYTDCDQRFLEIKRKNNKGRTRKFRIPHPHLKLAAYDFISYHIPKTTPSLLSPSLHNTFKRITLADKKFTERITIDFDISMKAPNHQKPVQLPGLTILEIKQDYFSDSLLQKILNKYRIQATSLSKYCLGMSITNNQVKSNNYKAKIHFLKKKIQL
ncbi:polyphosphate polymerase domain-containing protein [Marinilabilia salmonicolor]|jgi:hypothetical protein|nr:polyphosphate polymerase domain-containing protein [Marinilabilia salmonicolor]